MLCFAFLVNTAIGLEVKNDKKKIMHLFCQNMATFCMLWISFSLFLSQTHLIFQTNKRLRDTQQERKSANFYQVFISRNIKQVSHEFK